MVALHPLIIIYRLFLCMHKYLCVADVRALDLLEVLTGAELTQHLYSRACGTLVL